MSRELDQTDRRILRELQASGRLSIVDLAERVNLTKTPCSERVRRLEKAGVISEYRAVVSPLAVGLNHLTVVHIDLTQTSQNSLEDFSRAVMDIPEVEGCYLIAGSFDFMLKVRTRDITHYRELLGDEISKLPGVKQTHSFAVMETVKESHFIDV